MERRTKVVAALFAVGATMAVTGTGLALAQDGDGSDPPRPEAGNAVQGPVDRADLDQAEAAALTHVGNGQVTDLEADDGYYEVEVRRDDGTEVDLYLDAAFAVVHEEEDGPDGPDDDLDDLDDRDDRDDRDDDWDDRNDPHDD